jgi:hypothetical protein
MDLNRLPRDFQALILPSFLRTPQFLDGSHRAGPRCEQVLTHGGEGAVLPAISRELWSQPTRRHRLKYLIGGRLSRTLLHPCGG